MRELTLVLAALLLVALPVTARQDAEETDILDRISVETPQGWRGVNSLQLDTYLPNRPNTAIPTLGIKRGIPAYYCFLHLENAEIIPTMAIFLHQNTSISFGESAQTHIANALEETYSKQAGTPFRAFRIEESSIGGYRAYKVIGVYKWRTNNIKLEQYLIPMGGDLFELSYTNLEMDFSSHYQEFAEFAARMDLGFAPFYFDWLGDFGSGLLTILLVAAVIAGIYYLYSIRPGGGEGSLLPRMFTGGGDGRGKSNPFMKK